MDPERLPRSRPEAPLLSLYVKESPRSKVEGEQEKEQEQGQEQEWVLVIRVTVAIRRAPAQPLFI
jgi:hypothetical protein